ncbi:helix-turn-helix transcriptional regulator [Salipiger bermudensis]|uniref:helix-turn-helix transcriptional regulator n=1 Tax=Salipiger bermudensis TaxID=344736 RepID=UPI001CD5439D|nr:metalloregulator ArsR/SmtB family transcription factor [Salipiger bermudensis]MCA0964871.1 transcriptional regulator [Salipiger bermudensis]
MSSDDLEKWAWSPRAPSERLLMTLKMHGAQTSADVGRRQVITGEAARQQLGKLQEDGLVREERRSAGRGRPAVYWHLTDKAQARFPDTHAALTVDILRSISEVLGPEALDRIISEREGVTLEKYRTAMSDCSDTRDRLEKLAEMRSAEGYMAQVQEEDDGTLRLIENHCPICAAASFCQGFCRAEKAVFQNVLGPDVLIERDEHIVAGGRRCTYLVRERE